MTIRVGAGSSLGGAPTPAYTGPGSVAFNVKTYGAKIDGKVVTDGAMSSSVNPTHLSSGAAAFTTADVGKAVLVWGAGVAAADLVSTISSVSAGVATLADACSTTVSSTLVLYGTDDTAAWQAMLDALYNARGGVGYQPAGISIIAGALRTSPTLDPFGTGWAYNAQLTIPANNSYSVAIVLCGDRPMHWSRTQGTPLQNGGSYLASLSPGTPYATHSTVPSVIGGPDISVGSFTNIGLAVQDLAIFTPRNPQLTALNGAGLLHMSPRRLRASTLDYWAAYITQPTRPVGQGIVMPANNNFGLHHAEDLQVEGYYAGFVAGEHTVAQNISPGPNYIGVSWLPTQYHGAAFGYLDIEQCPYSLAYNDYTGSGVASTPTNGGISRVLTIAHLDIESQGSGWVAAVNHLHDPTSQLHGKIAYQVVQAGGPAWTVNGAANLQLTNLAA